MGARHVGIRVLQVGAGIRGRHWTQFIAAHPDFECAAIVEPDADSRAKAQQIAAGARFHESLDEALRSAQAEAALVVTPSSTHAEVAICCLEAGLPVLVEKPLATTVDDARRVLEVARARGKPVVVAENYRFFPAERTVKRLVGENFLGRIHHAVLTDRRNQPSRVEGPWLGKIEYPQLQEIATHHFDSLRALFGSRPRRMSLSVWNPPWSDYAHGACTEASIEFDGVRVQYLGNQLAHRYGFSLWIEGETGVLWTNRRLVAWRPAGSRWFRPIRNDKVPPGDEKPYPQGGTTSLLNSLRDAIRDGRPAETRGEDYIWTVAMVEAGKLADRERRTVELAEVYPNPLPDPAAR